VPLPGDVNTVTVTGYFTDSAGNPTGGTVAFTPTAPLTNPAGMLVIPAVTRSYTLQGGRFTSDPLVSTDNVTLSPSGWAYDVKVSIENIAPYSFTTFLPSAPSPVDMSALEPVYPIGTVLTPGNYLPTAGGTETGTLVLDGVPPLNVPGATVGQILASDANGNFTVQSNSVGSTTIIDGVAVSGITASGRVIMATDATHATWQLPLQLDTTNGDVVPLSGGSTSAGTLGQAAKADHNHSASGLLLLAGGTMSGAIAMGSHKITGLANGSASTDAAAFGQTPGGGATVTVAQGGTGDTSLTAYAPLAGGTTGTGVLQQCTTGLSTSGWVLTSTGSSSLPTFQASSGGSGSASVLTASYGTTSQTLNASTYGAFLITLSGTPTFTFSGATAGTECSFTLYLKQPSSGSTFYTPVWPGSVKWQDAVPPSLTAANSATDILVFSSPDGGTTWYGSLAGANY